MSIFERKKKNSLQVPESGNPLLSQPNAAPPANPKLLTFGCTVKKSEAVPNSVKNKNRCFSLRVVTVLRG